MDMSDVRSRQWLKPASRLPLTFIRNLRTYLERQWRPSFPKGMSGRRQVVFLPRRRLMSGAWAVNSSPPGSISSVTCLSLRISLASRIGHKISTDKLSEYLIDIMPGGLLP